MEKETKKQPKKTVEKETVKVEEPVVVEEGNVTIEENVTKEPKLVLEEKQKVKKAKKISKDAAETKHFAWLAYILFFIPLLINKNSPFVRHHANEGLEINIFDGIGIMLLILGAVVKSATNWVNILMLIFSIVGLILITLTLITKVYMIITTLKGKATTTPWFWDIRIIK